MLKHAKNPAVQAGGYPRELAGVLGLAELDRAQEEIEAWSGYQATPLHSLARLAASNDVGAILYKDEEPRFGLGSFKALGGAYAVKRLIEREGHNGITVCCATDGNHGRSVAWGAERFGCACKIYIHATVSEGRKHAIEALGAQVVRTEGNYDDSVRRAAGDAAANGWFVVSDTSYPGYTDIPRDVMSGYMLMAHEAFGQAPTVPSHLFVQGGVGGLAAAVLATSWQHYGERRPRFVVVEPDQAPCIYASIEAGQRVTVEGDLDTKMAGLACGEVSLIAWDILKAGVHDVMSIDDQAALNMMERLAYPLRSDPVVIAGESATCGLAAALQARADPDLASALGLDGHSSVMVFGTEGDTDPALFEQLVGVSGDTLRAKRAA